MQNFTNVGLFGEQTSFDIRKAEAEQKYRENGVDFNAFIRRIHERMLDEAQNTSQESPHKITGRGYFSTTMNWNVRSELYDCFPDKIAVDEQNRPFYRLADNVRLYFKKLDHKGRPMNIPTEHTIALNSCQGSLFGEPTMILYLGWQIRQNKYWDALSGIYLVEMGNMKSVRWMSDVSGLAGGLSGNETFIQPLLPVDPQIDVDEITVLPRTGAEGASETGS